MKSVELFCASPASTAICSSMDQRSMVRERLMRQMERRRSNSHPHRLGGSGTGTTITTTPNGRPKPRTLPVVPCSSDIPITPRTLFEKSRKSTSATFTKEIISTSSGGGRELQPPPRRKSSADVTDHHHHRRHHHLLLMSNNPMFDEEHVHPSPAPLVPTKLPLVKLNDHRRHHHNNNNTNDFRPVFKSSSSNDFKQQVVELRVSIHCKGCEGKIRKHISKMEGVTSYSTDLATKKVTVTGNVTPLGVLTSVSKVKYAEFWETLPTSLSSPSPSSSSSSVSFLLS